MADLAFISLRLVLPALWPLLDAQSPRARLVALVKPQFEAGKAAVRKGRGPVNPAPAGALAGAWPPGEPTTNLGTNQAATPNANSNLRRRGTKTRH